MKEKGFSNKLKRMKEKGFNNKLKRKKSSFKDKF